MSNENVSSLSLSSKIFIGLGLGIGVGLFFGELAAPLEVVGKVFVQLLQMAVLPYMTVSLIAGLGRLTFQEAKMLASKGSLLLILAWAVAFSIILLMPLAYPVRESASFFSTSIVAQMPAPNLLDLYIPANPFFSLANSLVPAVVLFSLAVGIALIGIEGKEGFLDHLRILTSALTKVTGFVVQLTPIGIFAIAANAAGTMTMEEFKELQVYLVTYVGGSTMVAVWILPGLVAVLTPIRYRTVLLTTKDALLTAFMTGNLFVVLPILAESSKSILEQHHLREAESDSLIDILIPISFNFPNAGKLLMLIFVPFAAWFSGTTLSVAEYPAFVISGLVTFFGSVNVAIPFLLDSFHIPADMFNLFLTTDVVNARFATLLAAVHVTFLALVGTCAIRGRLTINPARLIRFVIVTVVILVGLIALSRIFLNLVVGQSYEKDEIIKSMHVSRIPFSSQTHSELPKPLGVTETGKSRLDAIVSRGFLRVGFRPDRIPYMFFNSANELVGFDVDMANSLATDLGVGLEFVPMTADAMAAELHQGYYDIVMAGLVATPERQLNMALSQPYQLVTLAFLVEDHLREEFASAEVLRKRQSLTVGIVTRDAYLMSKARQFFPAAKVIPLESMEDFLLAEQPEAEALLVTAEAGSAYTLLYPQFTVVVPKPIISKVPMVYAMPAKDAHFTDFVDGWLRLRQADGTMQSFYDYWILGQNAVPKKPRWSIIRDVLHILD